jgi:spore coat polysaccharide biosynthesis protein SpsF
MKAIAIIQSRINSTRLPGKALSIIGGKALTYHVIERAKAIEGLHKIILATGIGKENQPLIDLANSCSIDSFMGSEDDVLERFYLASKNIDCDYIIRITGDNPLIDHISASSALKKAYRYSADHCTTEGIPLGTGVEVIKKEALMRAYLEGKEPHHREHVTPYIKEHPEIFYLLKNKSELTNPFPDLRLTVDTAEDLELIKIIYERLYQERPILLQEVFELIKSEPDLTKINSHIEQRPMTHYSHG